MTGAKFRVTFERVTDESAAEGDAESRGFVCSYGERVQLDSVKLESADHSGRPLFLHRLREALSLLRDIAAPWVEAIEANDSESRSARWVTVYGARDCGESESLSIHFPENATPATRVRLVRIVTGGAY